MRKFADLHIAPLLDDAPNAESIAALLSQLGISLVGLAVPIERLGRTLTAHDVLKNNGIDVAKRLDLKPSSRNDLLRNLRRHRNSYEIVAVQCDSFSVSQVAVRDRRVDIVHFPNTGRRNAFNSRLASTCRAALEITISDLTSNTESPLSILGIRKDLEIAAATSISVVGSTGASKPLNLRSPRDIAAILSVIGLPLKTALDAVSTVPSNIVERNRLKLSEPLLEQGVRISRS